jgi:sugar phosphate isomerase/epimerase
MNFAFMTFSTPELSWTDVLATAKRLGYAGVEPRITAKHQHGLEPDADAGFLAEARAQAAAAGVAICCIATSCRFADPGNCAENEASCVAAIALAKKVGSPRLRIFGGGFPEGLDRAGATAQLVGALKRLGPVAADAGVTLCLETHDSWCHPSEVAVAMEQVNHPAIAVNWDIMHPVRVAKVSITDSYRILKPWVRHMHVHDGQQRDGKLVLLPIGQGEIDHATALKLVKVDGYTGFISGEWIGWEPWATHLPRELAALKALAAQA